MRCDSRGGAGGLTCRVHYAWRSVCSFLARLNLDDQFNVLIKLTCFHPPSDALPAGMHATQQAPASAPRRGTTNSAAPAPSFRRSRADDGRSCGCRSRGLSGSLDSTRPTMVCRPRRRSESLDSIAHRVRLPARRSTAPPPAQQLRGPHARQLGDACTWRGGLCALDRGRALGEATLGPTGVKPGLSPRSACGTTRFSIGSPAGCRSRPRLWRARRPPAAGRRMGGGIVGGHGSGWGSGYNISGVIA